jgi:Tfp pilus assembly protein PilZ
MSQKDKKTEPENTEMRESARLDDFRPIAVEDLKAGIIHGAKMLNYSKTGMYFESDSTLQPGAKIYLGTVNSSQVSIADEFKCRLAEIVWRNKLKKSFYNYGYGVQFISADTPHDKEQKNKIQEIDSRKHTRKAYVQPVLFAANDQIMKGTTKNLSLSGIFLQTKNDFEVGQKIILSLPTKSKKRLKLRAEVIWFNEEGCGVKFIKKITE